MRWSYEKLDENLKLQTVSQYTNDADGSITGKIVMNVHAWFDENPDERIRLGWTKHISYTQEEIDARWPYNKQSQYLVQSTRQIDDYTIEDDYHVMDKTEEMMALEEVLESLGFPAGGNGFTFII